MDYGNFRLGWADQEIARAFDSLGALLVDTRQGGVTAALTALHTAVTSLLNRRRERAFALDSVSQRVSSSVSQLYEGVLDARMLPFGDGIVQDSWKSLEHTTSESAT